MLFFPSYQITCVPFLQSCLYRRHSASFQLVFCENYSMCRCILDVFVRGGEFHVLLHCHLDPSPKNRFLNPTPNCGIGPLIVEAREP